MPEQQQVLPPADRAQLLRTFIESAPRTQVKKAGAASKPTSGEHITKDFSGAGHTQIDLADAAKFVNGVHLDLYNFFDMEVTNMSPKNERRLGYVQSWVNKKSASTDEGITRLRRLMIKLGNWPVGEAKLDTVYNWLALNGNA